MTLQSIRDSKNFEELKPAIRFLCDEMQKMAWGEFSAFKRTIEDQAIKAGSNLRELNEYAENYQVFGVS
jgi:hypothetical protein